MKGRLIWGLLVVVFVVFLMGGQAYARRGFLRGGQAPAQAQDAGYEAGTQADDDAILEDLDLARICFVQREQGKDLVFIRIPPGMYRFAKARASAKRGKGMVRVLLRPRHHLAIENALGKKPNRLMLRLSAKRMRQVKGIKGHYTVRPLDQFTRHVVSGEGTGEDAGEE